MKRTNPLRESQHELERVTRRLREQHRELLDEYEQCCAEFQSAADGDSAEEDAVAQTRLSVADILSHLLREIREVEEALKRLRDGQYGLCVECGRSITASRLRAVPTARRCMTCQVGSERMAS